MPIPLRDFRAEYRPVKAKGCGANKCPPDRSVQLLIAHQPRYRLTVGEARLLAAYLLVAAQKAEAADPPPAAPAPPAVELGGQDDAA